MSTTGTTPASIAHPRVGMTPRRRTALVAGALYLVTFVSIPTLGLYAAVQSPDYVLGGGPDTAALVGVILEIIVALACIGTAVTLYPVIKAQGEAAALGFVGARVLEAGTIFAGVAVILTVVSLRQSGVGSDGLLTAHALTALHGWLNLGQGLMPAVNALLLGTLLYRGRLVPRALPIIGFVGAPLLLVSTLGSVLGLWGAHSAITGFGALLIAVWEFSLGVWLVVKGFRTEPAS